LGSDADAAKTPSDPSLRLLTRIADFVEPLTRFDRGHLALEASQYRTIEVVARQAFRVGLDFVRGEGQGPLPDGVMEVVNSTAMAVEAEAQLAAARAIIPGRLALWAADHGESPLRRPGAATCFTPPAVLGFVEACAACRGRGKIDCKTCSAAGTVECPACAGRGSRPCSACKETGRERCSRCLGQGYEIIHRQETVWDAATNTGRTQNAPERRTCGGCGGSGNIACARCGGAGRESCSRCAGQRTITCETCKGAGALGCEACASTGKRHFTSQLACTIAETFESSPRTGDAELAATLKALPAIEHVLDYAEAHRATAETDASTFRRETVATIPVTSIIVAVGSRRASVHGFGPQQDIRDYANIAGILLSDDLDALEAALPETKLAPPRTTTRMDAALASALASEANVAIAENPGPKGLAVVLNDFRGLLTEEHVRRTSAAMGTAIRRAYWAAMVRGPIAVLSLPLLQFPIELMLRKLDPSARFSAMLGVMLLAFGGAIGAHMLVTRNLEHTLAPGGAPRLSRMLSRQGHLRNWLLGAGAFVVLATLAVAGLANLIVPATP
jgi:hypothetical protein